MEIRVFTLLALFGIVGTLLSSIATADAAREGSWVGTKDDPFDSANLGGTLQLLEDGFQAYSSLQNRRLLRDDTRRKLMGKGDGDFDALKLIGKKLAGDEAHRRLMSLWKADEDVDEQYNEEEETYWGFAYGGDDGGRKLLGKGDGDYDALKLIGKKVTGDEAHRKLVSTWL